MAEFGPDYAEAAQREGLRDLQPRPEPRPLPPNTYMPRKPPASRHTTLGELFTTLSRCVRQAILLEARLDNVCHHLPSPPRSTPAGAIAKSYSSCASHPGDGTSLFYERLKTGERLEDDLAADANRPADEILTEICQHLCQVLAAMPAPAGAPRYAGTAAPQCAAI